MSLRLAALGSGSRGNAWIVEAGSTRLLIDCGFSITETVRRMERLGVVPDAFDALLVTHEHGDHASGVARFSRRFRVPVWLTAGTLRALGKDTCDGVELFHAHEPFSIGDVLIEPYPVPHDASEPAQFVYSDGDSRCGQLTDVGYITPHIERMLDGLDGLILECNYAADKLQSGPYPPALKARVGGDYGHLGNHQAQDLLCRLDTHRLRWLVGAHVSEKNNTHELARSALCTGVDVDEEWILVARQQEGCDWFEF